MSFRIVPASAEMTEAVVRIENESFSCPWQAESFDEALANPSFDYFVCTEDGEVAGYIIGFTAADECEIANVAVRSDRRGRGIGFMLMEHFISYSAAKGAKSFYLEVRASNAAAQALYKKCGFYAIGVRKNYYKKPTEDAVVMMTVHDYG